MIPQETTFTIGQFAAIHGIHKKTLMWYDQVGLLSPAFVGENGYRYYSYRQSARLETILMLRALEVSIPEIKTFLSHRSAGELRRLLTEKIAGVEGQIRRLEEIRHALVRQQASLARLGRLEGEYRVLPGHGSATLLSREREYNSFVRRAMA